MQTSLLQSVLVVALVGGCSASGRVTYAGEATAPDLVVISPGVQVIADLDTPIFYSDRYYWRNVSGFWYRSKAHTQGWRRAEVVPGEIRVIDPSAYVHYRGEGRAHVSGDRQVVVPPSHHDDKNDRHDKDDRHDKHDNHDRHDNKDGKHRDMKDGDDKRE